MDPYRSPFTRHNSNDCNEFFSWMLCSNKRGTSHHWIYVMDGQCHTSSISGLAVDYRVPSLYHSRSVQFMIQSNYNPRSKPWIPQHFFKKSPKFDSFDPAKRLFDSFEPYIRFAG